MNGRRSSETTDDDDVSRERHDPRLTRSALLELFVEEKVDILPMGYLDLENIGAGR